MRHRLALLAAICVLPGAASPQSATLQSVYECRTGLDASLALLATLPTTSEVDSSEPPGRRILRYYAAPAGVEVFGLTPDKFGYSDVVEGEQHRVMLMSIVPGPYSKVEAAVLAARGLSSCPLRSAGEGTNCVVYFRNDAPDTPSLMLKDYGEFVGIGCGYGRKAD